MHSSAPFVRHAERVRCNTSCLLPSPLANVPVIDNEEMDVRERNEVKAEDAKDNNIKHVHTQWRKPSCNHPRRRQNEKARRQRVLTAVGTIILPCLHNCDVEAKGQVHNENKVPAETQSTDFRPSKSTTWITRILRSATDSTRDKNENQTLACPSIHVRSNLTDAMTLTAINLLHRPEDRKRPSRYMRMCISTYSN